MAATDTGPLFIVGPSRSGSTIMMEAIALHEDLAWFSQYNSRFPTWNWVSLVHRVYDLPGCGKLGRGEKKQFKQGRGFLKKFLPKPGECFRKWNHLWGFDFDAHYRFFTDAPDERAERVRRGVQAAMRWQDKPRFVEKLTGPGFVQYLASVFPDAHFVRLDRESYPLVLSGSKYFADQRTDGQMRTPPWKSGVIAHYEDFWKRYDYDLMAGASYMVRLGREVWQHDKARLDPDRYTEVSYEDFMAEPVATVENILAACGLHPSTRVAAYVGEPGRYRNMNFKALEKLSEAQRAVIDEVMALPRQDLFPDWT